MREASTERANDTARRAIQVAGKWLAVAAWIALNAAWIVWRARRENDRGPSERLWPLYRWWFLAVTGGLIGVGILMASLRTLAGETRWERYWTVVVVGVVCLGCLGFEIVDMVNHCGLAYLQGW